MSVVIADSLPQDSAEENDSLSMNMQSKVFSPRLFLMDRDDDIFTNTAIEQDLVELGFNQTDSQKTTLDYEEPVPCSLNTYEKDGIKVAVTHGLIESFDTYYSSDIYFASKQEMEHFFNVARELGFKKLDDPEAQGDPYLANAYFYEDSAVCLKKEKDKLSIFYME